MHTITSSEYNYGKDQDSGKNIEFESCNRTLLDITTKVNNIAQDTWVKKNIIDKHKILGDLIEKNLNNIQDRRKNKKLNYI